MLLQGQIGEALKMSSGFNNTEAINKLRKSCLGSNMGSESRLDCAENE